MQCPEVPVDTGESVIVNLPDGRTITLPLLQGRGSGKAERFVDISSLAEKCGLLVFDPGFTCTASCASAVTFIDGPRGRCLYRGLKVDGLAREHTYPDVCYLLLHGELPDSDESKRFNELLKSHSLVHEKFKEFFGGFQSGAHPMAIMVAVVGALSAFYPLEAGGGGSTVAGWPLARREGLAAQVIAKFPTLAAMAYKTAIGEPIVYPKRKLSFAENFLHMMFARPDEEYKVRPICAQALEAFMILHADHEQVSKQ